jgi:hypothetical protein
MGGYGRQRTKKENESVLKPSGLAKRRCREAPRSSKRWEKPWAPQNKSINFYTMIEEHFLTRGVVFGILQSPEPAEANANMRLENR